MRYRVSIILIFILCIFKENSVVFAAENTVDPRDAAIDRAIGGMVEGSRPLLPQSGTGKNQTHKVPGGGLSPSMDTRVTASTNNAGANLGGTIHETTTSGNVEGNISSGAGAGNTGANLSGTTPENTIGGNLEGSAGGGASGGTGATGSTEPTTEPTTGGNTNDSIINVDANIDLSGSEPVVDANLGVDTNAQGGLWMRMLQRLRM